MPRRTAVREVERKIHFFRVVGGYDNAGQPQEIDLAPSLGHVDTLPFTEQGRYYVDTDASIICCWISRLRQPYRFHLGLIRRSDLPLVEEGGRLTALNINPNAGLAEQTHMVLFHDGIMGAEYNFYGPRPSRLCTYLPAKGNGLCPNLELQELIRPDVMAQLTNLRDVRMLNLRIHRSFINLIARVNRSLADAFRTAADVANAEEVEIILRARRGHQNTLTQRVLDIAASIARIPQLNEQAKKFIIKGYDQQTGRVETLDILNDLLISKKSILRQDRRTRALDSQAAFRAIEEAYDELRPQLIEAAGITR